MTSYRNSDQRLPIMQGSPPALIPAKMDWDRPPWNRWAFQHMREVLPTAEVWRGRGPVRVLPRDDRDLDALAVRGIGGEATTLAGLLNDTYADGFMVIKHGAVVYERYFNGMTERSLHLSQSVAKSFTAGVAGVLAGRGVLDVNAQVTDYLPELNDSAYRGASVQQVLNMTSGVSYSEAYTDPYSDVGQTDVASGWKPIPPGSDPHFRWPRHVFEQIQGLERLERRHGDLFSYRSIETDVLAFCLERAAGRRLPQLLSEEIWQVAGMEESANMTVDPAGYALASGGLNACLRDYGRFGLLYLEGGGGIIPPEWVEATRNGNHELFHEPYTFVLPKGAYQNQWWIEDAEHRSILARGVFGQMIYVNWQHQMVAVKLSSWPDFLNTPFNIATLAALHVIGEAIA
jgi:CubicO group peptidase (beta-lactamase class C family)